MLKLTERQKSALNWNYDLAVTAGAGTGKTLILIERYVDILINQDIDIRQLLAITFTNKAAAEMLNRVSQKIEFLLFTTGEGPGYEKLLKIRNHLSYAYISTIHAFCARLLREYPLETGGLDPGFSILSEIQSELMIEECINKEIAEINSTDSEWLELFRVFNPESVRTMLQVALEHRFEMEQILSRFEETSNDQLYDQLKHLFYQQVNKDFDQKQLERIREIASDIYTKENSTIRRSEKAETIFQGLQKIKEYVSTGNINYWVNLFSFTQLMTTKDGESYKTITYLGGKDSWTSEQKEDLLKLSGLLSEIALWMNQNIVSCPGSLELVVIKNLKKFYELYLRVETRYSKSKKRQNMIDFEDHLLLTYHLLLKDNEIRHEVSSRFKYIMVDEFQDINLLQWKIIELLAGGNENNLFIVGDPKQSIYGFRNADVRVFNSVQKRLAKSRSESVIQLNESFRFKKQIGQFINTVFSDILKFTPENQWEVGYDTIETKRKDADGGQIEFAALDKSNNDNAQAKFIATRIHQLLANTAYQAGEIAIILRSRTHLIEIENTLREHGIPFQTLGGIGFFQGQEIYDTFHMLKFLLNPNDDLALIGLLRSPFANITDEGLFFLSVFNAETSYWNKLQHLDEIDHLPDEDRERLNLFRENSNRWLARRDRIGYFELLSEIFNESLYRAIMQSDFKGDQIIANIDKLLSIILDYERDRFTSIVDFSGSLDRFINTYHKEGEAFLEFEEDNSVKIMTIHQAKGLEYPVIFLPYLNQKSNLSERQSVYFDEDWGVISNLTASILNSQTPGQNSFYLLDLLKFKQTQKDLAELKRLFYVGCTRARDHLILCGELGDKKIPPQTSLAWLLNSLKLTPEQLANEQIELPSGLSLQIHTGYAEPEGLSEKKGKKTIQSIDKLAKISADEYNEITEPPFLKTTKDVPKGEIFSATQLMTFIQDKEEYYKRYHLGFFEDDYEKLGMGKTGETDALLRGRLLHKLMEQYPRKNIEFLLNEVDLADDKKKIALTQELNKLVEQIDRSPLIKKSLVASNFYNEASILKKIGSDFITGTLDRLYKNDQNEWVVLDYKTNRIAKSDVIRTALTYKIQIETYALLIAGVHPHQKMFEICLYFIYPDELYSEVFDSARINSIEAKFRRIIEEIKQFYPYTDRSLIL